MLKLTVMHSFPIIQLKRFEQLNIKQGQSSKTSGKALQVLVRSMLYASVLVELICSICKCFLNLLESVQCSNSCNNQNLDDNNDNNNSFFLKRKERL